MQTQNSPCLLCRSNKATQPNSHIIPKFITRSILGDGNVKRAYVIGTDREHKAPEYTQDSPKEDFIVCPSCEQYFSVLEQYIARGLHNRIWHIKYLNDFILKSNNGIAWRICSQINPIIFRLFIYSIVWRISIASDKLFKKISVSQDETEILRKALESCKHEKQGELISYLSKAQPSIPFLPFILYTCESFKDKTRNVVFVSPNKNPYRFILNEYALLFSFDEMNSEKELDFLINNDSSNIKVGYFSEQLWEEIKGRFLELYASIATKNLMSKGEIPWTLKQELKKKI